MKAVPEDTGRGRKGVRSPVMQLLFPRRAAFSRRTRPCRDAGTVGTNRGPQAGPRVGALGGSSGSFVSAASDLTAPKGAAGPVGARTLQASVMGALPTACGAWKMCF